MEWTVTIGIPGFDLEKHTIPFHAKQVVYYVHQKKWWKKNSKWVISVCVVTGMWATNTYGVTLDNGEQVGHWAFNYLFTDKEEAIEYCIKKNAHAKVKIYGG